ncbi:MAG TPA: HAD-IB family hydrolase [Streptosporangiaceae bacterium]|nr:HAD-IB family hydrolase [Streptosporangiaceae bacterium]
MSNPSRPIDRLWSEEQLIADVEGGPQGPQTGAFLDFDGTLIDGYSLSVFARHHLRSLEVAPADLGRMLLTGIRGVTSEEDFEQFTDLSMHVWAGRSEDELAELGERLFVQGIAGSLYPEGWRLVEAHQRAKHTVVLASSATRFQVAPAAHAMGVEHILVSPVEMVDGICTGRPGGPLLWRAGKAAAVRAFATAHDIDLPESYAYSNGDEDVPFLRAVGRARAVNPGRHLEQAAQHYGWPVARFRSRRAGVGDVARTAAGLAGMLGGFATGMVLGAVTGSRREAVDLGTTFAGEVGSVLAGVRLDVRGGEHLMTRPAVFLFNHQSQLDVLILAKLLRGGFTGVAKKELAHTPGFGALFRLADVAFVDRHDTAQAIKALQPAVQKLREGISLVIAPEGTRSATPALGPFKKGAFHVAMQAGVPVVPIVIRNSGELMWRGAATIHPGTVQIAVLPPVQTAHWAAGELDEHIRQIRGRYLATLANWPPHGSGQVKATALVSPSPPPALPLDWGTSPRMNPLETAMWRAESADPRLRVNVSLLELLDPAPDWERLLAAHEWASRMVPRMRQRVVEPAFALGSPAWVTVGDFDLSQHVRRVRLPAPGSLRQLLDTVTEFAAAPLDRGRPLWQALLVEGLADGGAGYVAKSHHSVTDGLGAVQLMMRLHSRTAEHDPRRPEPPVPAAAGASRTELLAGQVADAVRAIPMATLRRGAGVLDARAQLWERASRAAGQAVAAARWATQNTTGPHGSALLAQRGGNWRFDLLDVSLADLKAGAKAAGGSLNDGLLAAVIGGFRRYHERHGASLDELTVGFPISLRAQDDPQGGNRFTGARFAAPMAERDPAARIAAVRQFVLNARAASAAAADTVPAALAPTLGWLPAPIISLVSERLTSANDVQVSSIPGVPYPVYIAGSRITRMYPFGPLPGCAAMITLISHDGTCCIGINTDASAVTDPGGLTADLRAGLDEIVALKSRELT